MRHCRSDCVSEMSDLEVQVFGGIVDVYQTVSNSHEGQWLALRSLHGNAKT